MGAGRESIWGGDLSTCVLVLVGCTRPFMSIAHGRESMLRHPAAFLLSVLRDLGGFG